MSTAAILSIFLVAAVPADGETSQEVLLENGIGAVLFGSEELLRMVSRDDAGLPVIVLPDGSVYRLVVDVSDPSIVNKGDGEFHPLDERAVAEALGSISIAGVSLDLRIVVYILPFPRAACMTSSESGGTLFLSPGVRELGDAEIARVVTHECAHAFQERRLPLGDRQGWERYLAIRGLDGDPRCREDGAHEWRPSEIFAEDFRILFGGENARLGRTIENAELPLPEEIEGLEEYLIALAASPASIAAADPATSSAIACYPNPFNPATTIRMTAPDGGAERARFAIYRVDGALVRELEPDRAGARLLEARWDGRDASGAPVPSGVYFCRGSWGGASATGRLVLLR